jgi:hypothetical protein
LGIFDARLDGEDLYDIRTLCALHPLRISLPSPVRVVKFRMVPKVNFDLTAATKNNLVAWLRKHVTRYDRTRVNIVSPGLCGKSIANSPIKPPLSLLTRSR